MKTLALLLLALLAAACQATHGGISAPESAAEVPAALERARALRAAGDFAEALELAKALRSVGGLSPELRDEIELFTEEVAHERLDELSAERDVDGLAELMEMELPRQLAVTAGVRAARKLYEEEDDKGAVRLIKKVDERYPFHHERSEAGEILFEAGMRMSHDDPARFGFLTLRDNGKDALEYLVNQYVSDRRWDQADMRIAELEEEDDDWEAARRAYEDLLFFRPDSPLRARAEARIPHVRLASSASPEYDRGQLLAAREELEQWLARYSEEPLAAEVRADLDDCTRRLWASDLGIGHFYRRNEKPAGARLHGERALALAEQIGDAELVAESRDFLAQVERIEPDTQTPLGQDPEELLDAEQIFDSGIAP